MAAVRLRLRVDGERLKRGQVRRATQQPAEDHVAAVQLRRCCQGDHELASIRIWPVVRHREQAGRVVLHAQPERLVFKAALAVDGIAAAACDVAALDPGALVYPADG